MEILSQGTCDYIMVASPTAPQRQLRGAFNLKRCKIITHILKKNMQITGNHQMAWIVRPNDESVREEYIRNSGKEQRFQDDGYVSRCYSTGRPRITTLNEDRYLAVTAERDRRSTASDLSRQLSSATRTTVSKQTVYRRLGHIGPYARKSVRCVPLTTTHCRLRPR
ncbi:transposable element Tcb1 transposase [Trichonephila clavipes]|uniref:Transposable element Tcb1 transposase n=1 Tax=Trichonephila clavipes TaxID=2585209 RepID=A0A8X6S7U6_TRICX|nr:transposable element Tcb1 transposase [Trichonephila clavipes]